MRFSRSRFALLACFLFFAAACRGNRDGVAPGSDIAPLATAVARPAEVLIGDRSAIEITIVAPANLRLLPIVPPGTLAGFEILDLETLPPEASSGATLQRTRVTLRAREIGRFEWPTLDVTLVGPDGSETRVGVDAVSLTVRSILPAFPGRAEPFGPRAAPEHGQPGAAGSLPAAIAGACLLGVAWISALLWRRSRRGAEIEAVPAPEPPWTLALAALDRAAQALRPADAAHAMAAALRAYMARRFGARSDALTTEELAIATPPFAATSRWPVFVGLLHELDDLRFAPGSDALDSARGCVEAVRARAIGFIETTTPPAELR